MFIFGPSHVVRYACKHLKACFIPAAYYDRSDNPTRPGHHANACGAHFEAINYVLIDHIGKCGCNVIASAFIAQATFNPKAWFLHTLFYLK